MKPIFIIYSSEDKQRATELITKLRSIGLNVFDPHHDIQAGDVIKDVLAARVEESRLVVLLITARFYNMNRSENRIDQQLEKVWAGSKNVFGYLIAACLWGEIPGVDIRTKSVVVIDVVVRDIVQSLVSQ